uniref:WD_REPEATS_REGION domain-containing protein n=1 Tax=Ascaris lumbricoides TaxID=6252 RepID=A0A0M3IEH4_ASCLU
LKLIVQVLYELENLPIQVLCEQVLLPSLSTVVRDGDQLAAEIIGRLRYTRAENSHFLNTMVEQAMSWVDMYSQQPLLVPLTCWISPPIMKQVLSFTLAEWDSSRTILQPTHNHQHLLLSGNESSPGLIYMYHIASQLLIRTFPGHTDRVTSISVSNNGHFFVSTSIDQTVRIWGFTQNEPIRILKPHKGKVMCSVVSADCKLVITGGTDSCANVICVETGELLRSFQEHTGTVISIALTSNDEFLVTGSGDFVVMVWDLASGELAVRLAGLMAPVSCITITSNDAFVIVACEDETLRVFGTVSGQELHELSGHEGKVLALISAYDDCQLFAATISKIYAYDLHNCKLLDVLDCVNQKPVSSLKITNDSCFLLSACGDRIDVWNVHHRTQADDDNVESDQQGAVTGICMSRDEKSAACATRSGVVAVWDLDICQCIWTMIQKKGIAIGCVQFTIDCAFVLSGDEEGQVNIWETSNGRLVRSVNYHNTSIQSLSCLSDGYRILSADNSNTIFIWILMATDDSLETDGILSFTGIKAPVFLSPNNIHLIGHLPSSNKEMKIWIIGDESVIPKTKIYHNEEITCYSTTTSGTLLVTGSADQSLKIWQIESGFLTQVLVGHEDVVRCCAIAEDERLVVSGGRDCQIIFWQVSTGDALLSLKANAPLTALSITADASVIFSADETGWIEAYGTENGHLLSSFNAHRSIETLVSSIDGNRILALLTNCAQLPILCLHNTPAGAMITRPIEQRKRSIRTQSNISETKTSSQQLSSTVINASTTNGGTKSTPRAFDKMDRFKQRASTIEKDRSTNTVIPSTTPSNAVKSSLCTVV